VPAQHSEARRYKTFRDHLINNICTGDEKIFRWAFGFFAHMMHRPRERLRYAGGALEHSYTQHKATTNEDRFTAGIRVYKPGAPIWNLPSGKTYTGMPVGQISSRPRKSTCSPAFAALR
jgi:hypothetical protein